VTNSVRLLRVDLASGSSRLEEVPAEAAQAYVGGSALAARLLYPRLTQSMEPLGPDAPLLFMTGPLTGTAGPAVGRFVICARSPATGLWGESNAGGHFGVELRAAGYDGLWISGRAPEPSYLLLQDGRVELRRASHLWGQADTYETQAALRQEIGEPLARVACIGLAGEAQIPFALILCDHGRVAGRTGMGAVMGSKRLKAVVVRGRGDIPLADPGAFAGLRRRTNLALKQDTVSQALRQLGSSSAADYFDYLGFMPKRYFSRGVFEGTDQITGASMAESILTGVSTCHGCVIACGRRVRLEQGEERKGPEYETMVGFGPNLEIRDLAAVTLLGELCDRYGMDTISLSNTIGLAVQLSQQGAIPAHDTGGRPLSWGDAGAVEKLVRQTPRREGLGQALALGARGLAERYGAPDAAVQVNGLEVPYHDPRGASGMALVYATSPRGACHNQGDYFMVDMGQTEEILGIQLHRRQGGAEKAANIARHQDWRTFCNALVLCVFANVPPQDVGALLSAATGFEYGLEEMLEVGERAWNLKRIINCNLGLAASDDRLPPALLRPLPDGGAAGYTPPFEEMLVAYYEARGWENPNGRPTRDCLRRLGLEWAMPPDAAALELRGGEQPWPRS
jgi:aldehyde:ferredoxin oxidoreductase